MIRRPQQGVYFLVSGRVQGVGYRWFGGRAARELGLTGWIRNRDDGRVEGEAWGEPALLETFLDLLRQGPPAGRVDHLDSRPMSGEAAPPSFEMRY